MKFSVVATLEGEFFFPDLLPGDTFRQKMVNLKRFGFESVEIWGHGLERHIDEVERVLAEEGVEVSVICSGFRGSLLSDDLEKRKAANEDFEKLLRLAGRLKARGLVFVPVFAKRPLLPDLSPWRTPAQLEREMLLDSLGRLSKIAEKAQTRLLIEPVNRYETHLVNRVDQAVEVCRAVGSPAMGVIADFYHMNIEETDIPATIREYGSWIHHYHAGDSNRYLPGQGHIDYAPAIKVLKEQRYDGALSLECFGRGDPETIMPQCARFLRKLRGDL